VYVCTMFIYVYMYYLLLRFYDNCREENRKRAAGRGWGCVSGGEKFERYGNNLARARF